MNRVKQVKCRNLTKKGTSQRLLTGNEMIIEASKPQKQPTGRSSMIQSQKEEPKSSYGKRNFNKSHQPTDIFHTPVKKVSKNVYHLSNPEKAYIVLHGLIGTEAHEIAHSIARDARSVQAILNKKDSPNPFQQSHEMKGRWSKGDSKLTDNHKYYLQKWMHDGSLKSARQAWNRLNSIQKLLPISYHPVRNFLNANGKFVRPRLKSEVSDTNLGKRVAYCTQYRNFNFRKVLFTDESSFQLNANNEKVYWRRGAKPPTKSKANPNSKIMVWGGISYTGKTSLFIVKGKLKAPGYIAILKNKRRDMKALFASRRIWYFQQDGAPCHRPLVVRKYITRWLTKNILPHPPQSPDLNPIELIWAQMKRLVEKKNPKNRAELLAAIIDSWNRISREDIRKVIDNLPKKMDKILELDGDLL